MLSLFLNILKLIKRHFWCYEMAPLSTNQLGSIISAGPIHLHCLGDLVIPIICISFLQHQNLHAVCCVHMILSSIKMGVDLKFIHCLSKYVHKEPYFIKTVIKLCGVQASYGGGVGSDAARASWPPRPQRAKASSDSYWLTGFIQPLTWESSNNLGTSTNFERMNKKGTEATHSSLEMQLVRVPRILECLILWAEACRTAWAAAGCPRKASSRHIWYQGPGGLSRKISCSQESHSLWEKEAKTKQNVTRAVELSNSSVNGLWFATSCCCKWLRKKITPI